MIKSRVLVVDDEEDICWLLCDFLSDQGYETHWATTGEDGIRLAKEVRPHLILLDIRLPGMDGITILSRVREFDRGAGIIIITAFNDIKLAQKALKLGASDFVTKPVDLNYLGTSVRMKIEAMLA